ncbi:hypothetical protein HDU98_009432 [Podochytrium sp. JEL0797]|nr:hypothetical protein HDU98_009432 [Podochytrium sp. JEL0797]
MRVGQTVGGILNATFGNAVELIVGIMALQQGLLRIVQASIIGSMLSNLLLVLGLCFFLGGLIPFQQNKYQAFSADKANTSAGLHCVVFLGFVIPAAYQAQIVSNGGSSAVANQNILNISRGTAIVLMCTYFAYLVFQLATNPDGLLWCPQYKDKKSEQLEDEEDEETPETLPWIALFGLCLATCLIGICAEFLVGSLEGLSVQANISQTFIGIIILPIVGNAAEHVTAVSSALRNKMDLVISVAVGSSMQIALLVGPLLVIIGWIIGQPLTLNFEMFETCVLFVTIFVVSSLISDGRTHWLEGWMLLSSYVIIAIAFYFV